MAKEPAKKPAKPITLKEVASELFSLQTDFSDFMGNEFGIPETEEEEEEQDYLGIYKRLNELRVRVEALDKAQKKKK